MAIAGRRALIRVSGAPVALANAGTTANADRTVYQITDPTLRVLDLQAPITVEESTDGGATYHPAAGYTLNRLTGSAIFTAARAAGALIRMSGSYLPLTTAGEAHEWTYTLDGANQDVSRFRDDYVRRIQAQIDASASLGKYFIDNQFIDRILAGDVVVLEFQVDINVVDLRMWAVLASDQVSGAPDGVVDESIDFEGTTDVDGRSAA